MLLADAEVDRRDFTVQAAFRVADGERVALFGPSGAGKTTMLEVVAGLATPRRGRVELAGRILTSTSPPRVAVPAWQRRVGLLRQDPGLFPHLSVRANLLYAPSARAGARSGELESMATLLGIEGLLDVMPAKLSGGQRHRVALGRLLLARCDALLLDEPFASLDAALRRTLTALVAQLVAERSIPSLLVTHQLADAQAFADRIAVLDRGQICQEGTSDVVVRRPASRRVAELVGYLGFVPARGDRARGGTTAQLVVGVHPDRVVSGAEPERGLVVTGVLSGLRPNGAGWEVDALVRGAALTCHLPERPRGERVSMTILDPPFFGPDGAALPDASARTG